MSEFPCTALPDSSQHAFRDRAIAFRSVHVINAVVSLYISSIHAPTPTPPSSTVAYRGTS